MKKVLFLATIAISLMACNLFNNEPKAVSDKDKKAAAAVTTEAPSMIGQDSKTISQNLTKAGYTKISTSKIPNTNNSPRRIKSQRTKQHVTDATYEYYIYGAPSNVESMTEKEIRVALFLALKSGKSMIQAAVTYTDGKAYAVASAYIAPAAKSNVALYTEASNAVYKEFNKQSTTNKSWEGVIYDHRTNISQEETRYTDHSTFIAGISAFTPMDAQESGRLTSENEVNGLYYEGIWYCPSEEEIKEMSDEGAVAFVTGGIAVSNQPIENLLK